MTTSTTVAGLLWIAVTSAAVAGASDAGPARTDPLAEAVAAARDGAADGFRLRVESTTGDRFRSLETFPSGVAVWGGTTQIRPSRDVRRALLSMLLETGFPSLEERYGGRSDPTREAALRVIRRVALEIGGLSKTSVQLADGPQSAELERLAEALLDRVAPLAGAGVTAADLADGLDKLAAGVLAPEALRLRFVELPPEGADAVGSILRLEAGVATCQPYAPGREVGQPAALDLGGVGLRALVSALRAARLPEVPVNLWSASHLELEVAVLQHRRAVIARPFSRLSPDVESEARGRLEKLVDVLRGLGAERPSQE